VAANPQDGAALESGRLELLGRLLPGALHELSNPLLALGGTLELLLADAEPGSRSVERLELAQRVTAEISQLVRLLQRLVRERGEPARAVDLAAFAEETASIALRFSGVKDVETRVAAEGEPVVQAEPGLLRLVLLDLVLDACRAAPAGTELELRVDAAGVAVPQASASGPAGAAAAALGASLEPLAEGGTRLRLGV
jgi:signal transduction histidine kinase